jgi:hypothetical protein
VVAAQHGISLLAVSKWLPQRARLQQLQRQLLCAQEPVRPRARPAKKSYNASIFEIGVTCTVIMYLFQLERGESLP